MLSDGTFDDPFDQFCPPGHEFTLDFLLSCVVRVREHQTVNALSNGPGESEVSELMRLWARLFRRAFLFASPADTSHFGPRDDMVFLVDSQMDRRAKTKVHVFRKSSSSIPMISDRSVNWEETFYLNLLMQYCIYVLTVAVCTRTGLSELQILRKFSQTVYASPSFRRMDAKGHREEFIYPNLCFTVDNFDEAFADCIVRDSESLCVELTAYDLSGQVHGSCFLGAVQYDSLKKLYDSKPPSHQPRAKFVRMLGPQSKGLVEFALSMPPGSDECRRHQNGQLNSLWCVACRSASSRNIRLSERSDFTNWSKADDVITQQPIDATAIRSEEGLLPVSTVAIPPLRTLQPLLSSVRSAGASVTSSPIICRRGLPNSLTASVSSISDERDALADQLELHRETGNGSSCLRKSKVASILSRLTNTSQPMKPFYPGVKEWSAGLGKETAARGRNTANSFDHSLSWFNERRRVSSVPLSAALTFLSLSSRELLLDLADVRRDPILKVAD